MIQVSKDGMMLGSDGMITHVASCKLFVTAKQNVFSAGIHKETFTVGMSML